MARLNEGRGWRIKGQNGRHSSIWHWVSRHQSSFEFAFCRSDTMMSIRSVSQASRSLDGRWRLDAGSFAKMWIRAFRSMKRSSRSDIPEAHSLESKGNVFGSPSHNFPSSPGRRSCSLSSVVDQRSSIEKKELSAIRKVPEGTRPASRRRYGGKDVVNKEWRW